MLTDDSAAEGDWLVSLDQTAGRGRQGRAWLSLPGNFYGSTLVTLRSGDPAPQTLSLAAGLALIEGIDVTVPGQPLLLKWPNDLMLGGKKLAGILLERSGDRVAVGFGVNLAAAPQLLTARARHSAEKFCPRPSRPCSPGVLHACSASGGRARRQCLPRPGSPGLTQSELP